jgi:capsular polysaccharide export protein
VSASTSSTAATLKKLLRHARGTVLVNSTVGLYALRCGCSVKVLGVAVFDLEGLAFQGPLDHFWGAVTRPDAALRQAFIRVLAATTQLKGSFFNPLGRAHAIEEMVQRLLGRRVNEPGAFVDPPPRLASARAAGVPV